MFRFFFPLTFLVVVVVAVPATVLLCRQLQLLLGPRGGGGVLLLGPRGVDVVLPGPHGGGGLVSPFL